MAPGDPLQIVLHRAKAARDCSDRILESRRVDMAVRSPISSTRLESFDFSEISSNLPLSKRYPTSTRTEVQIGRLSTLPLVQSPENSFHSQSEPHNWKTDIHHIIELERQRAFSCYLQSGNGPKSEENTSWGCGLSLSVLTVGLTELFSHPCFA